MFTLSESWLEHQFLDECTQCPPTPSVSGGPVLGREEAPPEWGGASTGSGFRVGVAECVGPDDCGQFSGCIDGGKPDDIPAPDTADALKVDRPAPGRGLSVLPPPARRGGRECAHQRGQATAPANVRQIATGARGRIDTINHGTTARRARAPRETRRRPPGGASS